MRSVLFVSPLPAAVFEVRVDAVDGELRFDVDEGPSSAGQDAEEDVESKAKEPAAPRA